MHSFPTERARLKVRNPSGDVRVETADTAETTVELLPLNDSEATREAIAKARVSARGDEVTVELEGRSWSFSIGSWGVGSPRVGVRIRCPYGSELDCDTASADLHVDGRIGEVRFRTASGDARIEHVDGPLTCRSASGDVRVRRVEGRAEVHSVSGDTALEEVGGELDANSVSGDVAVGRVGGDVTIGSISGDQEVRAAGPGRIALKAVSGDVSVALRPGLGVRLDVNSVSGSIESELDAADGPRDAGDGGEADLRVRTVSGDVRIARAAPVEV